MNVAKLSVAPMDEHGYFSFGLTNCTTREMLEAAEEQNIWRRSNRR